MMSPKISIIVPVYNIEHLIATCLETLIAQTLSDIEIICVDDQSSDSSLSILRSYAAADARIKVIAQENRGPGGARNRGLDEASGEFILFIDGDDFVELQYCEKMYQAAERHQADMVVVGMKKIYSTHSKSRFKIETEACYEATQEKIDAIGYDSLFYVMNKLIRHSLLQQNNLRFAEGVYFEDVMFAIRLFSISGRMVTLPDVNYMYVNHTSGITKGRPTKKKQDDHYAAIKELNDYCERHNLRLDSRLRSITVREWGAMGLTLLKIKERAGRRVWRLFDLIPIYTHKR